MGEFFTEKWHYTNIDAPGHRDFIKNMITGASQADVALIMVPADGNFTTAIAKGTHKAGEIQGQTRQHSRLINLLGVKQMAVGVNKMDCDTAGYKQGVVKPGEEVVFLPTHTASNPCTGKVFTVEMHHQRVDFANPGDNVGLNIKGLDKNNMPRSGDVMVYKKDTTLGQTG